VSNKDKNKCKGEHFGLLLRNVLLEQSELWGIGGECGKTKMERQPGSRPQKTL
jgi:hypothetical protein